MFLKFHFSSISGFLSTSRTSYWYVTHRDADQNRSWWESWIQKLWLKYLLGGGSEQWFRTAQGNARIGVTSSSTRTVEKNLQIGITTGSALANSKHIVRSRNSVKINVYPKIHNQRYIKITHDPLLFSVAQRIFWISSKRLSRSTLHLIERGGEESVLLYSVTKSPKAGPLLTFSVSLCTTIAKSAAPHHFDAPGAGWRHACSEPDAICGGADHRLERTVDRRWWPLSCVHSVFSARNRSYKKDDKPLLNFTGSMSSCSREMVLLCTEKRELESHFKIQRVWCVLDEQNRGLEENVYN